MRVILVILCFWMPITPTLATPTALGETALRVAPDFTRTDIQGKPFHLRGYRGKVVLLNFWATWCGPCLKEIPTLIKWQHAFGTSGLQIVGISMDDDVTKVMNAYREYHFDYPVVMGDAPLGEQFGGVFGLPLSYLIDAQGGIVDRFQGALDLQKVELQIKSLLSHP